MTLGGGDVAAPLRIPTAFEEVLEAQGVELVGRHVQHVARRAERQAPAPGGSLRFQGLAHPADVDAQRAGRRVAGRGAVPELVDEHAGRDGLVRPGGE